MNPYISNNDKDEFGQRFCPDIAEWFLEWVTNNLAPEDVYDYNTLSQWALDNGYVTEE
jgi:hypothetical protein